MPDEELEFDPQGTDIEPQPGPQTILLAATDIQEVFFGGALMAGKSYALGLALEAQHQRFGGAVSGIIIRQSVPELDDLIKTFQEILEPFGWNYLIGKKTFKHPDGAECRMRHLEVEKDIKKYWGHQYSFMGIDEMGDMSDKTFQLIQRLRAARLRSPKGVKVQFVATGNPCGAGHKNCKKRYIDPAPPFTPFKDARSKHNMIFIPGKMENNIKALLGDPEYKERCKSLGPDWYVNALINGDWTISPEGNMFHREWFDQRYKPNELPEFLFKCVSWDTAFKTTKDSAESAATVWGVTKDRFYLLDAYSEKLEFPELKQKGEDLYNAHLPIHHYWIEDKASGPSMAQSLKKDTRIPVKTIKVDLDKQRRAFVVTPLFESRKIFLPVSAPWVDKYIDQLCSFPAPTGFADLVDSTSQALTQIQLVLQRMTRHSTNVVPLPKSLYGV